MALPVLAIALGVSALVKGVSAGLSAQEQNEIIDKNIDAIIASYDIKEEALLRQLEQTKEALGIKKTSIEEAGAIDLGRTVSSLASQGILRGATAQQLQLSSKQRTQENLDTLAKQIDWYEEQYKLNLRGLQAEEQSRIFGQESQESNPWLSAITAGFGDAFNAATTIMTGNPTINT